ncbi:hypothetical protein ACGTJS_10730 [Faucicola mancuniensis]
MCDYSVVADSPIVADGAVVFKIFKMNACQFAPQGGNISKYSELE